MYLFLWLLALKNLNSKSKLCNVMPSYPVSSLKFPLNHITWPVTGNKKVQTFLKPYICSGLQMDKSKTAAVSSNATKPVFSGEGFGESTYVAPVYDSSARDFGNDFILILIVPLIIVIIIAIILAIVMFCFREGRWDSSLFSVRLFFNTLHGQQKIHGLAWVVNNQLVILVRLALSNVLYFKMYSQMMRRSANWLGQFFTNVNCKWLTSGIFIIDIFHIINFLFFVRPKRDAKTARFVSERIYPVNWTG